MRITAVVEEVELEGDCALIDSIVATCTRCGHETKSYGTTESSVRRCLVRLREECPRRERNFYVDVESRSASEI